MVSYCCVNGCGNTSKKKKENPISAVSFHVFPANKELRSKWLRAIGRPNWSPSNHARVCSAHFTYDQMNHDSCKIRIKDDTVPVLLLPLNSNFEASNVEACRICLATDLKLFSLQDTHLETCMKSIAGLSQNGMDLEDMPQYVCYQCAPSLIKCNQLIDKCITSQATLLDIQGVKKLTLSTKRGHCTHHYDQLLLWDKPRNRKKKVCCSIHFGRITKDLIKEKNKSRPTLKALENSFVLNDYLLKHNDDNNTSPFTSEDSIDNDLSHFKSEDDTNTNGDTPQNVNDVVVEEIKINSSTDILANGGLSKDFSSNAQKEEEFDIQVIHTKKMSGEQSLELTPDETNMLKYFDIVQLSLHEQVKEWEKSTVGRPLTSDANLQCEICNKSFASVNSYRGHSFGRAQCLICKLRFKSTALATSHSKRAHSKKFFCKMCPKAFNNVMVAKKHQRWHSGYLYKCYSCPFFTLHESSLRIHMRRAHANAHPCALCGRTYCTRRGLDAHIHAAHSSIKIKDIEVSKEYGCEQCSIDFASEGARRIHILTSTQHRKKPDLCDTAVQDPNLPNICEKCGVECATARELSWHRKSEHPRPRSKDHPSREYPKDCELCGDTLPNRKKHWHHVRKQHPGNTDTYKRVQTITCICDTCGKGFQNSTKLRLHQLRHRSPSVRCPCCPRLFYDKYALAAHAHTHDADRPHQCRTCGAAFKQRCNLDRHYRVHSDIATFECTICGKKFKYSTSLKLHVNYVHNKLPYPKRKKRMKSVKNTSDS